MKIKDLEPEVREKAIEYTKETFKEYDCPLTEYEILESDLFNSFVFSETPEGLDYWIDILHKNL